MSVKIPDESYRLLQLGFFDVLLAFALAGVRARLLGQLEALSTVSSGAKRPQTTVFEKGLIANAPDEGLMGTEVDHDV